MDSTFVTAEDVSGTPAKQVFLFPATKYAEENFRVVCTNIVMMGAYRGAQSGHLA
ncbi:MAG: hypothetical protein ACLUNO_01140 [Oscillospiraceae bacterium]